MNRKFSILILISLLMVTAMSVTSVYADGETSPIYINDNSDFATSPYVESGDGSASTPYIISGDTLESFGDACIYIENTDVYAIFENIYMHGIGYYGVYLNNVSNVNVTNSVIEEKSAGILIQDCSNIFLNNVEINNRVGNNFGIKIDISDNISVRNCNITDAKIGIALLNSFRVEIVDNVFIGSGLSFYGTCQVSTGIRVTGNTVNGKPIGYLYNKQNAQYDISGYGQAILVSCTNITLYNANISETSIGVQFIFSQNCIVAYSNFTNNYFGGLVYESSYCRIISCNFTENVIGLTGFMAVGTIIRENNFINNTEYGIWVLTGCSSSSLSLNNFIGNGIGNARDDGTIQDSNLIWLAAKFTNKVSGQSLSNVSVTIEKDGRTYTGYSNEDGLFKVPLPMLGEYNFTIEKFRYETKYITNYEINATGINFYEIGLNKADLGPGTGYVLARFMDETTPVTGATVRVYSYLDGAYYFHSEYTSSVFIEGVQPAGWVNITGLYYDDYFFVITHPNYERRIINQIVIATGEADGSPYNNIQLTALESTAFIYGWILDEIQLNGIVNATITLYDDAEPVRAIMTTTDGFFNMTNIEHFTYNAIISKEGFVSEYREFTIDSDGSQPFNPVIIALVPEDYVPETVEDAVVNNWDNDILGNYWDDLGGGLIVIASDSTYTIVGINPDNPIDEYPLDEPYVHIPFELKLPDNIITTVDTIIDTTTTTTTVIITQPESFDIFPMVLITGLIFIIVILILFKKVK